MCFGPLAGRLVVLPRTKLLPFSGLSQQRLFSFNSGIKELFRPFHNLIDQLAPLCPARFHGLACGIGTLLGGHVPSPGFSAFFAELSEIIADFLLCRHGRKLARSYGVRKDSP
jgi:hypothetical protein